jgi:hypothetical protein
MIVSEIKRCQPMLIIPVLLGLVGCTSSASTWNCSALSNTTLVPSGLVWWTQQSCTGVVSGVFGKKEIGPIVVNTVHAVINNRTDSPRLRPAIAQSTLGLARLHELAVTAEAAGFMPLAGVNGGYFFEVNRDDFFDDVCWGKRREDALRNASLADPNAGIGDGLTILNGEYVSSNCDKLGNSKPVAAVLDYPPRFVQLGRGERLPAGVLWAIAAGPNLVSRDPKSGKSYVSIEGDNVNILERASNTAVALRDDQAMLVTFDGVDGCVEYGACGVNSHQLAAYLLDYVHVDSAMEMDQGGSTAMWVRGQPNDGVVSNPGKGERELFNGLFIGV